MDRIYRAAVISLATRLRRKNLRAWSELKSAIRYSNRDSIDVGVLAEYLYRAAAVEEAMRLPEADKLAIVPSGEFSERTAGGIATAVIEELVRRADVSDRRSW